MESAAHEISMIGLFFQADVVVKGVMLLLLTSSVVCWAVILDKSARLVALGRSVRRFETMAARREEPTGGAGPIPDAVLVAGLEESRDRDPGESRAERRDRLERAMRTVLAQRLRRFEQGLPFLATVGSAAPFVGLFGTVWGIMNSFTAIAGANDTSLAVVAPGIAEALFATAIGLLTAIPAVVGYNKLSVELGLASRRLTAAIGSLAGRMARHGDDTLLRAVS